MRKDWFKGDSPKIWNKKIQYLIDNEQPFVIAKYLISSRFISDRNEWKYELILWQTREDEEGKESLSMSKEQYNALIENFHLTKLHSCEDGTIHGINTELLKLSSLFKESVSQNERRLQETKETYRTRKFSRASIALIELQLEELKAERKMLEKKFCEEYQIYTFKL